MPKIHAEAIDRLIGARIRERRRELGLTLVQLGALIGVAHQQLQKYERGTNQISVGRLLKLANALDAPPQFFLEIAGPAGPLSHEAEQLGRDLMSIKDAGTRKAIAAFVRALGKR